MRNVMLTLPARLCTLVLECLFVCSLCLRVSLLHSLSKSYYWISASNNIVSGMAFILGTELLCYDIATTSQVSCSVHSTTHDTSEYDEHLRAVSTGN